MHLFRVLYQTFRTDVKEDIWMNVDEEYQDRQKDSKITEVS